MDDFIKYLLVTEQLDEVFWCKEKEQEDEAILKRTLKKDKKIQDGTYKNSSSSAN